MAVLVSFVESSVGHPPSPPLHPGRYETSDSLFPSDAETDEKYKGLLTKNPKNTNVEKSSR